MNGQMCAPVRPPMSCGQPPMARHPSREQLIDYLMLKVSQQPPGAPRVPQETLQQEVGPVSISICAFEMLLHLWTIMPNTASPLDAAVEAPV